MTIERDIDLHLTRRQLFGLTARGIGAAALGSLLSPELLAARTLQDARDPKTGGLTALPHFAPKAKRVIFLHQSGGPSQLETFDYKPSLAKFQGTQIPDSVRQGQRVAQTMGQSLLPVAKSAFSFARYGQAGTWVSELLPHTAKIVDDITVIKTMYTDAINHDPAITFIQTGFQQPGRPSMGAWLSYGLGSENQNLPAFVVLLSQAHAITTDQPLFSRLWASGFLPSSYQGVRFRAGGDPVLYPRRSCRASTRTTRRQMLDAAGEAEHDAARGVRRSGDRDAHRPVRDGVPDADVGSGTDGSVQGAGLGLRALWARVAQAGHATPPTVCSRGGSPSATCASSSSITAAGISTATCRATSRCSAAAPISRPPRSSPTSSSAACSTTRSSSGAASSAGRCSARAS